MLKTTFTPLDREQFALLRESKRIVQTEFDKELKLQDKDILDQIYAYALESKGERLFEILNSLSSQINNGDTKSANQESKSNVVSGRWSKSKTDDTEQSTAVKVGDTVDGKICVGFYRGQPTFK